MGIIQMARPLADIKSHVSGHYTLQRRGPDGRLRQQIEFDNVITDLGLDQIYNAPTYAYGFGYYCNVCCVGTGNTPPSITDTALAGFLAAVGVADASMIRAYVPGPPVYWSSKQTYRFGTGVAAGNLTEVGTYPTNGSQLGLFSRALIVDGAGAPTTLTVLSDEILDVTYELRVYINTADVVGTFVANGVTYDTVIRPADINAPPSIGNRLANSSDGTLFQTICYDGNLGTVTTQPGGNTYSISYNNGDTKNVYSAGDRRIDVTTTTPVGSANWANGVKAFYFTSPLHKFQMSFIDPLTSKGIPKVTGQKMTCTFRFSWDRYAP